MCGCLSHAPYWGPSPQPRHVPWLGIKPVTLQFTGRHSIQWVLNFSYLWNGVTPITLLPKKWRGTASGYNDGGKFGNALSKLSGLQLVSLGKKSPQITSHLCSLSVQDRVEGWTPWCSPCRLACFSEGSRHLGLIQRLWIGQQACAVRWLSLGTPKHLRLSSTKAISFSESKPSRAHLGCCGSACDG